MNLFFKKEFADTLWNVTGDFGVLREKVAWCEDCVAAENKTVFVNSRITHHENGVCVRTGTVRNISGEAVTLYSLGSKFTFDGGEYAVYSQSNSWHNESRGGWQPLVTGVFARSAGVRNAHSAAPFMVLWSEQRGRGTAFHVNAASTWEMRISRVYLSGRQTMVEVELGVAGDGFALRLLPGEEVQLPEIIYYEVLNKRDLDCWKLHGYLHQRYPRKSMPVIYNSWLYRFDQFTGENILPQIEKARELGVEYFVIDAGWFGNGPHWFTARGDWEENLSFGFRGEMAEVARQVRASGMKFGLWLEVECAHEASDIFKTHPEYFIGDGSSRFLDFSNEAAKQYILEKTCQVIDRYQVEFIKFDFNSDLLFDEAHAGFLGYVAGHMDYIKRLKQRYPELYLENCASGGMRMAIRDGKLFDSFWPTDNQSPYEGTRIFKDTMLRLPPQWLESWVSLRSAEKFTYEYGREEKTDRLFTTNDATWNSVVSIDHSYLRAFLTGHPVGLTFDLTALSSHDFAQLKSAIEQFKAKREFWQHAVCHVLADTDSVLALEFRNTDFSQIELVVIPGNLMQGNLCVYPVLAEDAVYETDGQCVAAAQLCSTGIGFAAKDYCAQFCSLKKL